MRYALIFSHRARGVMDAGWTPFGKRWADEGVEVFELKKIGTTKRVEIEGQDLPLEIGKTYQSRTTGINYVLIATYAGRALARSVESNTTVDVEVRNLIPHKFGGSSKIVLVLEE